MAKMLLTIIILFTLAFIVAMYCALVIAGRSDDDSNEDSNGGTLRCF